MNRVIPVPATPASVLAQIAQLPDCSIVDLKALWLELHGSHPSNHNRAFLERRIAYRLQEKAFRKVAPALLERNAHRIDKLIATGKVSKTDRDFRPVPGTVITREYQGKAYRVTVGTEVSTSLKVGVTRHSRSSREKSPEHGGPAPCSLG